MVLGVLPGNDGGAGTVRSLNDIRDVVIQSVIEVINRENEIGVLRAPSDEDKERIRARIHTLVGQFCRRDGYPLSVHEQNELTEEISRRVLGLGFLDLLLPPARTDISEIAIYSSGLIQVMPKGSVRWETVDMSVPKDEVWRVLRLIFGPQHKSLTEATPSVNAKLPPSKDNPGGGRIKALHPCIAPGEGYPSVNIRLYEQKPVRPKWLLERGLMTPEMMDFLGQEMLTGRRILITGGTRTGKTTTLSALCNYLPEGWRIVKIEDPAEIWIDRKTVQTVEARTVSPGSEVEPYTLADGVDDAMRMSPDYLIIGEVRDGAAASALFRALMTGHSGACTFHADNPREAIARMATIMGADKQIPKRNANEIIMYGIDLLVQIGIRHEVRRVTSIAYLEKELKGGDVWFVHLWRYDEDSPPDAPRWKKYPEAIEKYQHYQEGME